MKLLNKWKNIWRKKYKNQGIPYKPFLQMLSKLDMEIWGSNENKEKNCFDTQTHMGISNIESYNHDHSSVKY